MILYIQKINTAITSLPVLQTITQSKLASLERLFNTNSWSWIETIGINFLWSKYLYPFTLKISTNYVLEKNDCLFLNDATSDIICLFLNIE